MTDVNKNIENNQEENQNKPECNGNWWKNSLCSNLTCKLISTFICLFLFNSFCYAEVQLQDLENIKNKNININSLQKEIKQDIYIYPLMDLTLINDTQDSTLKNCKVSLNIDVVKKINENEYLLIGGYKTYDSSNIYDGSKGTLIYPLDTIYKINIKNKEIEKICETKQNNYTAAHIIDKFNVLLIGYKSIEKLNLKTKSIEEIFVFNNNNNDTSLNYAAMLAPDRILYMKSAGTILSIIDLKRKKIQKENNFLRHIDILYRNKILLNKNTLLCYNGIKTTNYKESADKNYIYLINENIYKEDFKFGNIQHIQKISDDILFIIRSEKKNNKKDYQQNYRYQYKYKTALLYNLKTKKVEQEITPIFDTFNTNSIIPEFHSVRLNNKIFFSEDSTGIRQVYNIDKHCFEKIIQNSSINDEFIQHIINIDTNKALVLTLHKVYILENK